VSNDIKKNNLGNAFIFMVRYALPRKTSADMATTTALRWWWEEIPQAHKKIILEEIRDGKDLYGNDPFLWDDFLKWVESAERIIKEKR
jgi:hypothetical protein